MTGAWPSSTPKSPSVPGTIDHIDVLRADQPLGGDEFEVEHRHYASCAIFSALATASSMPPTM